MFIAAGVHINDPVVNLSAYESSLFVYLNANRLGQLIFKWSLNDGSVRWI